MPFHFCGHVYEFDDGCPLQNVTSMTPVPDSTSHVCCCCVFRVTLRPTLCTACNMCLICWVCVCFFPLPHDSFTFLFFFVCYPHASILASCPSSISWPAAAAHSRAPGRVLWTLSYFNLFRIACVRLFQPFDICKMTPGLPESDWYHFQVND